jgi:hypothetical protein
MSGETNVVDLLDPVRWYQRVPADRPLRSFHDRNGHGTAARRARLAALTASRGEAVAAVADRMTEAQLQDMIRGACAERDLLYYHTYRSTRSPAGYPDLHIVGPRGDVLWEEKTERKPLTDAQFGWLNGLWLRGRDADEVRPSAWWSGWVEVKLDAIAAPKHEPPAWYRPQQRRRGGGLR